MYYAAAAAAAAADDDDYYYYDLLKPISLVLFPHAWIVKGFQNSSVLMFCLRSGNSIVLQTIQRV